MEDYRRKIKTHEEAQSECADIQASGRKVVFTNGCFDLLHPGHARYLQAARRLGDYLVVAVNSDASVQAIKGPRRPVQPQEARVEVLAALACVDAVVIFEEEDPFRIISLLVPDVLVKGGDWAEDAIIGADVVKAAGGRVMRIPFEEGYSTTAIIEKILHPDF